ncbi:MAG: hypothetical protein Q8N45_10095, partial [Anaerolineales bacterium]|nr:hypothetical protein [Anaerolineales bacterium]
GAARRGCSPACHLQPFRQAGQAPHNVLMNLLRRKPVFLGHKLQTAVWSDAELRPALSLALPCPGW